MKNISKKVLVACCSALCATTCVAGIATSNASAKNKYAYVNSLLQSNCVQLKDSYAHGDRTGLLLSSPVNGGVASYKDTLSGKFSTEFDFVGENTEATFYFKDRENYTQFAVRVFLTGKEVSAYVEYEGAKGGVYYADGVAIGQTAEKNASNLFTRVSAENAVALTFDPSTMTVRLGEYLVWDLSAERNDGASIGQGLNGFAYYSMSVCLDKAENGGGIVMYELLGESLSYKHLRGDSAAPAIYADFGLNGVVDQRYALPKPYVYDLQCGNLAETGVDVKIEQADKTVVFEGKWTADAAFTPTAAGEYLAVYTATDESGNKGEQRFAFNVLENAPRANFIFGHTIKTTEVGTGSILELPTAKVTYGLFNMDSAQYAEYFLTVNGTPITNISGRKANKSYKLQLSVAGVYELSYRFVKGAVELESEVVRIVATNELPALSDVQISREMYVGSQINVAPATFTLKGEKKNAAIQLLAPDGTSKTVGDNEKITLNQAGLYALRYTAEFNGVTYTEDKEITLSYSPISLFRDSVGIDADLSYFPYEPTMNGLVVSIKDDERAEFAQAIDFSDYDGRKPFIEFLAISKSSTVHHTREYFVTLTDVNDYGNSINIRINGAASNEQSWVSCAPKGGATYGWNGSEYKKGMYVTESGVRIQGGGTAIQHSFRSVNNYGYENQTIKLYFDYENRQIFVDNGGVRTLVADLDDYAFTTASGASFNGFSEGKAYVGITYTDFGNREVYWSDSGYYVGAHELMVLQYAGYDFRNDTTVDRIPPEISVNVKSDLPLAVVGKEFKVFDAWALDGIDGETSVGYAVYKGNDRTTPLVITDGCFTPDSVGPYSIVYTAFDGMKNEAEKTIVIEAVNAVPAFSVSLAGGEASTNAKIGETVALRAAITDGGVGYTDVKVEATLGGEGIEIVGNAIKIESVGDYEITYTASDYIGNTDRVSYTIKVATLDNPLFDEEPVATYIVEEGSTYRLPVVTATDYSDASDVKRASVNVFVSENGGAYTACGESYTPSADLPHGAKISFKYVATGDMGATETVTSAYYSKIDKKSGSIDMRSYFVTDGANATLTNLGANFDFAEAGIVLWGKSMVAEGFKANINFANITSGKFILSDSVNGKERVEISIRKLGSASYTVSANGGEEIPVDLSGTVEVGYKAATNVLSIGGASLSAEGFAGFTSGLVYMAIEGAVGNGATVVKLFNQNINTIALDNSTPIISLSEEVNLRITQGKEYTLPTAIASDVLADLVSSVSLTVQKPDGSAMTDTSGKAMTKVDASVAYTLKFTEAGKYKINYTVKDSNGKTANINNILTVAPFGAAAIDIAVDAPVASAAVGSRINLAVATVEQGVSVFTSVLYQTGGAVEIAKDSNSFIAERAGVYTVKYTAYDSRGNFAVKTFEIKVG